MRVVGIEFEVINEMRKILRQGNREFAKVGLGEVFRALGAGKRTKVVATMGPATESTAMLEELIKEGLNVFRLNFSHGDYETQGKMVDLIRKSDKVLRPYGQPILMDLKGPSVRTGFLEGGKSVTLVKGQRLTLTTDYTFKGNKSKIACSYVKLPQSVKAGDTVFVGDGNLNLRVESVEPDQGLVHTIVQNNYTLGERKNMNLPGNSVDIPTLTEKDKRDIAEFAAPRHIDAISVSFCRTGADVREARRLLAEKGSKARVVAKIENHEGLYNLEEILKEVDAIMIARGDLGMEIPPEKVPVAQLWITQMCRKHRRPVITATQMLESMTKNARPTRAEVTDVFFASQQGTDAVMLSGETSAGEFPLDAVRHMRHAATQGEALFDHRGQFHLQDVPPSPQEALFQAAAAACIENESQAIVVLSSDPQTARLFSSVRAPAFLLAPHHDDAELRFNEFFSGLYGVQVLASDSNAQRITKSLEFARKLNLIPSAPVSTIVLDCDAQTLQVKQL